MTMTEERGAEMIPSPGSVSFEDRVGKSVPFEWGYGSTPRVAGLRDALCWKATVVKEWVNVAMGIGKCQFRDESRLTWTGEGS